MTSHHHRALALIEECTRLEAGSAQVATAQEAVRQADLSGLREVQILARDALIDAATFAGRAELSLVAFAWNIAHFTTEELGSDAVWFHFQWLAEDTPLMLATKVEDVEHILREMERVYEINSWYLYPLELARFRTAEVFGATQDELFARFDRVVREVDRTTRQSLYLRHVLGAAYLSVGKLERGVQLISRNFSHDDGNETEYPTRCHGIVVLPMRALGQHEEAEQHFRSACRMVAQNPVFIREIAGLVGYAALTGDLPVLARLLERHLGWAATNFDRWSSMRLYLVAAWALDQSDTELSLRLADEVPGHDPDGTYPSKKLAAALRAEGMRLAAAFDERHGRQDWVPRALGLLEHGDPLRFLNRRHILTVIESILTFMT